MAAGIVASTLRRKAFHKRALHDSARYQAIEPGHIGGVLATSPTDDGPPTGGWRTSSIVRVESPPSASRAPTSQLSYRDFWPACLNAAEINLYQLEFETFEYVHFTSSLPVLITPAALSPVHTSNNVGATFDIVAFDNVAVVDRALAESIM